MQYWTELYKEIADKIKGNLQEVRHVDLWHDQVSFLAEELPFDTPAIFIGFSTVNIDDMGTLVQECVYNIIEK
ncbi:hypothetical protein [Dysgonomonas sp. ZJ279]|uniref:hypothetical protein n=1 Tax=Dysgonomonas sp. ZJ279 TaxID=2709796 RepID=UPI0013EDCC91|nr:hypothetical protein [Dysgonomonas sp. ZJ279]